MEITMRKVIKIDEKIYYVPSKSLIAEVAGDLKNIDFESWIIDQTDGLQGDVGCTNCDIHTNQKMSTDLTIISGTKCNLRCIYCYSEAGEIPELEIDFSKVKLAIDRVILNAKLRFAITNKKTFATIKFTGGGEPTCNWKIIQATVDYLNDTAMRKWCHLIIQTNGQLTDNMSDSIIKDFDEVVLSCDGFSMIQNLLRPRADGEKSWPRIDKFLQKLNLDNKINFFLRSTVTNDNVSLMAEICGYFFEKYDRIKYIHFEPLGPGGRGKRYATINLMLFYNNLKKCQEKFGNRVGTSMNIHTPKSGFCCDSQSGHSIVLTPTGKFVSCVEDSISDLSGDMSWVISQIDENGLVKPNEKYISKAQKGDECNSCIAYKYCYGGCPQRIIRDQNNKNISPYGKDLCKLQKLIIRDQMKELLRLQPKLRINPIENNDYPRIIRYCCI